MFGLLTSARICKTQKKCCCFLQVWMEKGLSSFHFMNFLEYATAYKEPFDELTFRYIYTVYKALQHIKLYCTITAILQWSVWSFNVFIKNMG